MPLNVFASLFKAMEVPPAEDCNAPLWVPAGVAPATLDEVLAADLVLADGPLTLPVVTVADARDEAESGARASGTAVHAVQEVGAARMNS